MKGEPFRFPRTPHLAWLGSGRPRDDKVLSEAEAGELLSGDVVVEEKIDGANLGISLDERGELRAHNRGAYLVRSHAPRQFGPLFPWLDARAERLAAVLSPGRVLFGEWCYARHAVHYTRLPDWFLGFDVYDEADAAFWSTARRDDLLAEAGLAAVPRLAVGRFDLADLCALLGPSRVTDGPAEGLYVRREEAGRLVARAKLVRAEFTQAIGEHWSRRALQRNALAADGGGALPGAPPPVLT